MRGLTALLALLLASATLRADAAVTPDERTLAAAREAFRRGRENVSRPALARRDFARAADGFRTLHLRGVRTPALYRDLGNAELLADRPWRALWAYHCGLRLAPNDARLRQQVEELRARVGYPSDGRGRPAVDAWPPGLPRPTVPGALATVVISYPLACLLFTGWRLWRRPGLLVGAVGLFTVAVVAAGVWWRLENRAAFDRQWPLLVVVENSVPFQRGNGPSYPTHPDVPALPGGLEVRQRVRRGGWIQVELTTGEVGWVPAAAVRAVEPALAGGADSVE